MIRSRLVNFLNRNWLIQLILCFLPIILIIVYIFCYMYDISGLLSVFEYNNKITQAGLDSNIIKEVSYFEELDDNSYSVIISDSKSVEEDVALGDTIYTINILGNSWYQIVTKSGEKLYQLECDLFGVEQLENNTFNIIVDDKSFKVDRNDIVCDVKLGEDGDYEIEFLDDSIPVKKVDFISSLQVMLKNNDKYRLKISSAYEKEFDSIDINFCTNLPTDNIYYDESSQSFIKNIAPDFGKSFILGSNVLTVIFSMSVYCIILGFIRKRDELILLRHKEILLADICSIFILIICTQFTLVLF